MRPSISRRSLLAGTLGGVGVLASGGYAWNQYATRNALQFRPLEGHNESDEPVTLTVTASSDGTEVYEGTYDLAPAGDERGEDTRYLAGPWIKHPDEYSLRVATDDEEFVLVLENSEIIDRLEDTGWGSECARVTITVTDAGTLESAVATSEQC
ncbi:hypothetical protein [Natronoglomus mannanivorans]|uniref:Uncharacterized protein n=1 Tax=Natronoglomus mannanivorans TaxID=2979990 RepID=A0AAP2Z382_9EURY|nr:hypothetical protein [Halobacteria archaeon AArc-xg1-1]